LFIGATRHFNRGHTVENNPFKEISITMGCLIAVYSLYSLLVKPKKKKLHSGWSCMAGFSTGLIGTAFSTGWPPDIITQRFQTGAKIKSKKP